MIIKAQDIKVGDLIKLKGVVQYADGPKEKISKKTWVIGEENGEPVLPEISEGMEYVRVGSQEEGVLPQYLPMMGMVKVAQGSVPENYKVLKDVKDKNWKAGEVVKIIGKVSKETLENGWLEKVGDEVPHKHVLVIVDPISFGPLINNPQ